MMQTPLEIAYDSMVKGDPDLPFQNDKKEFILDFQYPLKPFPIKMEAFQSCVRWDARSKKLGIETGIMGVSFINSPETEAFFNTFTEEIRPFMFGQESGGRLCVSTIFESQLCAPGFVFFIPCGKETEPEALKKTVNQYLFDRAALALWLTRTICRRIGETGFIPPATERHRLLLLEHGAFQLASEGTHTEPPEGLYATLYTHPDRGKKN